MSVRISTLLRLSLSLAVCLWLIPTAFSQANYKPAGVWFLENKTYDDSDAARKEILDLYKGMRITDFLDGMDLIGIHHPQE